jgi:allantoinase
MFELVVMGDLVLPDRVLTGGYLAITDGSICAVGVGAPPAGEQVIDATGKYIFPGGIDGQVHAGSAEGIEGLEDATIAAAAGGVTTIVDMPFDDPYPVNTVDLMQAKIELINSKATVDVALYATARKGAGTEGIVELADAGACAYKVSTYEYHPVRFPGYDTGELYELFPVIAETGLSVAFHNEDPYVVQRLTDRFRDERINSASLHGASRPPVAELIANVGVFEIARITGVRCHIVHSSLARGFDHVKRYRDEGVKVSAETCIQYLVFDEDDVIRMGAKLKQNPPIRSASEKTALWKRIVDDEVDFVSSDHVAWPVSKKSDPDFFKNGSGMPGLETMLAAFFTGMVTDRGLPIERVAALLCERPARHFGLYPRKGALIPGADADFLILDQQRWVFEESQMASAVKWSPYNGHEFGVRVVSTYVRGQLVYDKGSIVSAPGTGQFVRPVN